MGKIYAMFFSATDTTKKTVMTIASEISKGVHRGQMAQEGEADFICVYDFTLPKQRESQPIFQADDIVVLGTPVIAGRVPNVLLPYLKTLNGRNAMAVPVVLYGNRNYDDALIELRHLLQLGGFQTIAAGAFIGEHSFSNVLAVGRPDEKDKRIMKRFAKQIAEKVLNDTKDHPVVVRGQIPYRFYYQPQDRNGQSIDIRKVKPKVNDLCTRCGVCADVCPMGSISRGDVLKYTGICMKCGACIKKCPSHARYYDDEGYLYHKKELEEMYTRRAEPEVFL